jgi:hypothetical protein
MTITLRGALPSILNDASSAGSAETWPQPLTRKVLPAPEIRNTIARNGALSISTR